jgi:hypothetical protein
MQIVRMKIRSQSAVRRLFLRASTTHNRGQLVPAASMSGLVLTLIAVLAGTLGAWRLGVDPGWTSPFFVGSGLFSRYQLWFALALGAQTFAFVLNRWVANQVVDLPALAV